MLQRLYRFHGYGSLRRVYQQGTTIRGSAVSLRYFTRKPDQPYRVAVVVSKKVSKSAVVRNRIRRRVYEIVRVSPLVPPATDLVFTVFSDQLAELETTELQTSIAGLLQKVPQATKKTV